MSVNSLFIVSQVPAWLMLTFICSFKYRSISSPRDGGKGCFYTSSYVDAVQGFLCSHDGSVLLFLPVTHQRDASSCFIILSQMRVWLRVENIKLSMFCCANFRFCHVQQLASWFLMNCEAENISLSISGELNNVFINQMPEIWLFY